MTWLPNAISIIRILLVPVFFVLFYQSNQPLFIFTYVLAGISDFLDGYLAKKLNATSPLGHFLDTLADFPFYIGSLWLIFEGTPGSLQENHGWIWFLFFLNILMIGLTAIVRRKLYFEHTELFRIMSAVMFVMVLLSTQTDIRHWIPWMLLGYVIAYVQVIIRILRLRRKPDTTS